MTYDITLYDRDFLLSAVKRQLGDWTSAPVLPEEVRTAIVDTAKKAGFNGAAQDPRFVAFAAAQGHTVADEYLLDTEDCLVTLMLFANSVAFAIPSSPRATMTIARSKQIARELADAHQLGYYDPQEGEVFA